MSNAQKLAITRLWPLYGLNLENSVFNFKQIFKREAPTEIEIGFGNGDTLISFAIQHPEKNFIGIDVHKPGVGTLLLKIEKNNLSNVKVICADAVEVIRQYIPEQSLNAVYLLFPDPWPKRRHHKRRILQPYFIELLAQKLISGGKLALATDWEDYAQQMKHTVSQNRNLKLNSLISTQDYRPTTKFETRGKKLGYQIWDLIFERV